MAVTTHLAEKSWRSADGLALFGQRWRPLSAPIGHVALVHGLGEHSGRYHRMAQAFAQAGFETLALDLRGHGRSEGPRGHAPSYDALLDDIELLLAQARGAQQQPLFLVGHSLGGNLVINYALRRNHYPVAGVVALAPGLRLAFQPPPRKLFLGRLANRVLPRFAQANGLERTALSRDASVVDAYCDDPLVHDRVSARLALAALDAGRWALVHAPKFPVPLLLMHGTADRVASFDASQEFAAATPPGLCTFEWWDGCYHELHHEPVHEAVMDTMVQWMVNISAHGPAS